MKKEDKVLVWFSCPIETNLFLLEPVNPTRRRSLEQDFHSRRFSLPYEARLYIPAGNFQIFKPRPFSIKRLLLNGFPFFRLVFRAPLLGGKDSFSGPLD